MAHPFAGHREHKVQQSRVGHITKGYAEGGDVTDEKPVVKPVGPTGRERIGPDGKVSGFKSGGAVQGRKNGGRLDRYARGGKVKPKGATNVNVIIAPQGGAEKPPADLPPMGAGMPPVTPPVAAASPPPPPMMPKPPMMPPGMPMRASGGRVKSGAAWEEGRKNGTQVQHTDGKNDGGDIYRPKQVTYARGGKIEASDKRGPKLPGGDNGKGRLAKAALQRRSKLP